MKKESFFYGDQFSTNLWKLDNRTWKFKYQLSLIKKQKVCQSSQQESFQCTFFSTVFQSLYWSSNPCECLWSLRINLSQLPEQITYLKVTRRITHWLTDNLLSIPSKKNFSKWIKLNLMMYWKKCLLVISYLFYHQKEINKFCIQKSSSLVYNLPKCKKCSDYRLSFKIHILLWSYNQQYFHLKWVYSSIPLWTQTPFSILTSHIHYSLYINKVNLNPSAITNLRTCL